MTMYGLKRDWELEPLPRAFSINDYEGNVPRWCPGCGDHAVLSSMQRLARDEQIPPEKIVVVSGIGCSSRLPHYMKTFGFHGLHGRPLPVACGVRARRPDLHVFVVTGDGDCCAIGAGHWLHAIRYNMKMVVLMLDNNIYGMTKMQTSPTTPKGQYCSLCRTPRSWLRRSTGTRRTCTQPYARRTRTGVSRSYASSSDARTSCRATGTH
jgi:2-oxoglutarate ferredoxin oxidoreductase subunit beta